MKNTFKIIRYLENHVIQEIHPGHIELKKEKSEEVLYTSCGLRIPLESLLSMNGIAW